MAKSFSIKILKNEKGQSAVEYILLLAVISAMGYTFYNNKTFKDFANGNSGLFALMREGMSYSYRYGIELKPNTNFDQKMNFEYSTNAHDIYMNQEEGTSHFFSGIKEYP